MKQDPPQPPSHLGGAGKVPPCFPPLFPPQWGGPRGGGGTKGGDQGGGGGTPDLPNTGVTATSATTFDRTPDTSLFLDLGAVGR